MQCELCRESIAESEPIYRLSLAYSHGFIEVGAVAHACARCIDGRPLFKRRQWCESIPCDHCARPVIYDRYREVPLRVTCGPECRRAVRSAQARARRACRRREWRCRSCGKMFPPKRTDALFCSGACRQRSYKRRRLAVAASEMLAA
jgi:hypothetical protein